jgi:hypothetical protein
VSQQQFYETVQREEEAEWLYEVSERQRINGLEVQQEMRRGLKEFGNEMAESEDLAGKD